MSAVLRKLVQFTPADWWGLSIAYLYLLWAGWRLFVRREKLDRWVINGSKSGDSKPLTEEERRPLASQARWVNAAARHPLPWARCLQRSLAFCLWMEQQEFQPELKIGVRKDGVDLKAHAWVEHCGQVLNDNPDVSGEFAPLTGTNMGWAEAHWEVEGS